MRREQIRCTIRAYNLPLLEEIRRRSGMEDISDLVNFVLSDYKVRFVSGAIYKPLPVQIQAKEKDLSSDIAGLL